MKLVLVLSLFALPFSSLAATKTKAKERGPSSGMILVCGPVVKVGMDDKAPFIRIKNTANGKLATIALNSDAKRTQTALTLASAAVTSSAHTNFCLETPIGADASNEMFPLSTYRFFLSGERYLND